jgi:C-8 sterol isomerase
MMGGHLRLFGAFAACALAIVFHQLIAHEGNYVFDAAVMESVAKEAVSLHGNTSAEAVVGHVVRELRARYPQHVAPTDEWLFNNAGGAMGAMTVLHSSFSEYVIIFGTATGTEGHTGRFLADDYFTILDGEQWAFEPGAFEKEVYKAGEQHHLPMGVAKQYRMPDQCWALEYARGNILSMMPFGLADLFFSTLDPVALFQTVRVSGGYMLGNALKGKF